MLADIASTMPVARRWEIYRAFRQTVRQLAAEPACRDHAVAQELLDQTLELEERLEQDADGRDSAWRVKEVTDDLTDLIATLARDAQNRRIDDPREAARFILTALHGVDQETIGRLVGVDPRTIRTWNAAAPRTIRKNPERVVLVAQLIQDLQWAMTPRGTVGWFGRSRPQLAGRTPLDLLDGGDVGRAAAALRPLARGSRGQLDT